MPVAWDELEGLTGGDMWTISSCSDRLAVGNAPWLGYAEAATPINEALEMLGLPRR